jgi:hypothetical protein
LASTRLSPSPTSYSHSEAPNRRTIIPARSDSHTTRSFFPRLGFRRTKRTP